MERSITSKHTSDLSSRLLSNNTNIAESPPQIGSPHHGPQLPLVSHVAPRTAGERARPKMYMMNEQDGLGLNNRDIVKLGAFLESRNQNHPILISGGVPSQQLQAHYARNQDLTTAELLSSHVQPARGPAANPH